MGSFSVLIQIGDMRQFFHDLVVLVSTNVTTDLYQRLQTTIHLVFVIEFVAESDTQNKFRKEYWYPISKLGPTDFPIDFITFRKFKLKNFLNVKTDNNILKRPINYFANINKSITHVSSQILQYILQSLEFHYHSF